MREEGTEGFGCNFVETALGRLCSIWAVISSTVYEPREKSCEVEMYTN